MGYARQDYTGEKYITNEGYEIEIIEYFDWSNCTVLFNSGLIIKELTHQNIKKGQVKNPNHKSIKGIGYIGIGKYGLEDEKAYKTWSRMLERCYCEKSFLKYPSYKTCSVHSDWHNFQNFAKWFEENYIDSYHLDKDILIKGNKIYSPDTCCFVPREINSVFTNMISERGKYPIGVSYNEKSNRFMSDISKLGKRKRIGTYNTINEAFFAYKTEKEKHIKELADKWRDKLTHEVYYSMYSYKVEIND